MENRILFKAAAAKQKLSLCGVFIIVFIIAFTITCALSVYFGSKSYISNETERLGFGDVTVWTSDAKDENSISSHVESLDYVEKSVVQPLIFSGYSANGIHSDNNGQLLRYAPKQFPYHFIADKEYIEVSKINEGEIYVSPATQLAFNTKIGDEITFELTRNGVKKVFVIKGYFEDPFMGSSMIDMKSFLISDADYADIISVLKDTLDFDVLAKSGAMLHIYKRDNVSEAELAERLSLDIELQKASEFAYTKTSVSDFMLILQNVFAGFLMIFALILTAVSLIVTGYCITNAIRQEQNNIGILKAIGYHAAKIRKIQTAIYLSAVITGLLGGSLCFYGVSHSVSQIMLNFTGFLIPRQIPVLCIFVFALIAAAFIVLINIKTERITRISLLTSITNTSDSLSADAASHTPVKKTGLSFYLALRRIVSGKKRYTAVCIIAALLVFFFTSVIKIDAWLGVGGEGLMNAFSAAQHDIGIQPTRATDLSAAEEIISSYSTISNVYELAMQKVTVGYDELTANVINDASLFHIISGKACENADEIVITQTVAKNQRLKTGDKVTISVGANKSEYTVSGIYSCANEMGANVGMNTEGYSKIADLNAYIWCRHYVLADSTHNEEISKKLRERFRMEADIHTNSWSGLEGIIAAMNALTLFMYIAAVLLILIVVILNVRSLMYDEKKDINSMREIGMSFRRLRLSFAMRFFIVALIGALVGSLLSIAFSDRIISVLLRSFGIASFSGSLNIIASTVPVIAVVLLFAGFAYVLFFHRNSKRI